MNIVDITRELFSCPVFPGDRASEFTRVKRYPEDDYQLTELSFCAHSGTHADAPLHVIPGGAAVDELEIGIFYGPCLVGEYREAAALLADCRNEERLLIKGEFEITPAAARGIARSKLRLLGVESQSVGPVEAPLEAHQILLGAGIVLLESLDLSLAAAGRYTLAAFPMKLGGCDGAPMRAVLIEGEGTPW